MANPLFDQFSVSNNEISRIMKDAQHLRQQIQNPRQEVERLLQSGEMSQADFNRFSQIANQILGKM